MFSANFPIILYAMNGSRHKVTPLPSQVFTIIVSCRVTFGFLLAASGASQWLDQRGRPSRRRALPHCQVRENKIPRYRSQRVHRDLRVGTQALPQVHGLQGTWPLTPLPVEGGLRDKCVILVVWRAGSPAPTGGLDRWGGHATQSDLRLSWWLPCSWPWLCLGVRHLPAQTRECAWSLFFIILLTWG